MSTITPLIIVNRLVGVLVGLPSFQTNISILNCVFCTYKGTPVQIRLLAATCLAICADILMLTALTDWFLNYGTTLFLPIIAAFNAAKRIYSINTVNVTYLRYVYSKPSDYDL
jgi:hypothetical protein